MDPSESPLTDSSLILYKLVADMSPSKSGSESVTGRWTKEEHKRFLDAMNLYGKNWKKVQEYVGTRSTTQVRSHAQKHLAKVENKGNYEEEKVI